MFQIEIKTAINKMQVFPNRVPRTPLAAPWFLWNQQMLRELDMFVVKLFIDSTVPS